MARRRATGVRIGYASTMTSALLICVAVAVAMLGHIQFKNDLHRLDRDILALERAITEQRKVNRGLQMDYETLVSPLGLEARLREMKLDLVIPGDGSRVVLREPAVGGGQRPETDSPEGVLALGAGSGSERQP